MVRPCEVLLLSVAHSIRSCNLASCENKISAGDGNRFPTKNTKFSQRPQRETVILSRGVIGLPFRELVEGFTKYFFFDILRLTILKHRVAFITAQDDKYL